MHEKPENNSLSKITLRISQMVEENVMRAISSLKRSYHSLLSSERRVLFFLFLLILVTRLPFLILVEPETYESDVAYYTNIAENIEEGDGLKMDFKEIFLESDGTADQNNFGDQGYGMAPSYPLFLSVFIYLGFFWRNFRRSATTGSSSITYT